MGLNGTVVNFEKSYIMPASEYTNKLSIIDVFTGPEIYDRINDYEYMKIIGIQFLAYPDTTKQRLYMNLQWAVNQGLDNIRTDDSTKILTWPSYRNQSFYFLPPNVALHFPQTTTQYVRVNLRKEWIAVEDFRTALLNEYFPCELYFDRVYDQQIDFKVTIKVKFRRSTTDTPDSKGLTLYKPVQPEPRVSVEQPNKSTNEVEAKENNIDGVENTKTITISEE